MDKLDIKQTETHLTPGPVGGYDPPTLDAIYRELEKHAISNGEKTEWMYGKSFGNDVLVTPEKIMTDVTNIIINHIKSNDDYVDSMSVTNRKTIAEILNKILTTYDSGTQNIDSSSKIVTKLLSYLLTLHVLQKSVKS